MVDETRIQDLPAVARIATEGPVGPHSVPAATSVARIGGSSRPVLRGAAVVAVLVLVAMLKPWAALGVGVDAARPDAGGPAASVAPGIEAAGIPTAGEAAAAIGAPGSAPSVPPLATPTLPPGAVACGVPTGWRFVFVSSLAGRPGDVLAAIDPTFDPQGPVDARIASVPAGQAPVVAVGACRPASEAGASPPDRPPVLVVAAWRIDREGATEIALVARGPSAGSSEVARLYVPAVGADRAAGWAPGRYVVELRADDLTAAAWIGFTVTEPPSSGRSTPVMGSTTSAGGASPAGSPPSLPSVAPAGVAPAAAPGATAAP